MSARGFVLSGCSGGGKSSLLDELARRGFATVAEPGRRIVREEEARGGDALPWRNAAAFAGRLVEMARADLAAMAAEPGPVFFDRGLIDAAAARARLAGVPVAATLGDARPYARQVFLAPPWPAIYRTDAERRHSLAEASAEFDMLTALYPALGYRTALLPLNDVAARADFVLAAIA